MMPRLLSLWEIMQLFDSWRLTKMLHLIECARRDGIKYEIDSGKRDEDVPQEFLDAWITNIIADARELATKAELECTQGRVGDNGALTLNLTAITFQELDNELKVLRESVQTDLGKKYVYVIEHKKEEYITRGFMLDMWGRAGFHFPSIRNDINEAMWAYGTGRNTACVFHLMRLTEIGLRALARRMRIKLPRNRQLEWGQWNDIIVEMNKKSERIANKKAGKARDVLLEFYRGSVGEFLGFKDAYRNFVMHMREKSNYDEDEARSLIGRVAHFMDRLSGKIDEHGRILTDARIKRILAKVDAEIAAEKEEAQANEQAKTGV